MDWASIAWVYIIGLVITAAIATVLDGDDDDGRFIVVTALAWPLSVPIILGIGLGCMILATIQDRSFRRWFRR